MLTVRIDVEDPAAILSAFGAGALGRVESSATETGTYVEVATFAITTATSYSVADPANSAWHRARYSTASPSIAADYSDYSAPFPATVSLRTTMSALIARLRLMVGDADTFTDDEMQDALDRHRTDVLQAPLTPRPTLTATGYQWLNYSSPWTFWESGAVIVDSTWTPVTPSVVGDLSGRWTFATSRPSPLYISGKVYDLFGAAVDILRAWQAKVATDFDFTTDGQSFSRSQKGTQLSALAAEYRRQALPGGPRMVGADMAWTGAKPPVPEDRNA